MHVLFLLNEFPVDGHLRCFQPFAITNNVEIYVLNLPKKFIEMEPLSQKLFTI